MQDEIEKAYYFSKKEFALLLGMSGADEVYSFHLPGKEEITNEDLIYTLYRLVKKELVRLDGGGPSLCPGMKSLMDGIRKASLALSVIPKGAGNQKIIYLSSPQAVLTEICDDKGRIRAGGLSKDQLWERLTDEEELGRLLLETEEEGEAIRQYNEAVQEEYRRLEDMELVPLEEAFPACMEMEPVYAAWELFDLKEKIPVKRCLFLKGGMNSWLLVQDREGRRLSADTGKGRERLKEEFLPMGANAPGR